MAMTYRRSLWLRLDPPEQELNPIDGGNLPEWQSRFESGLEDGSIQAAHWPADLPTELPPATADRAGFRRYRLRYVWDASRETLGVVSCNPSFATSRHLDATLAMTTRQADLWGFGGVDQCNLSPDYGTDVSQMNYPLTLDDPQNFQAITEMLSNRTVWLAWGAKPQGYAGERLYAWNAAEDRVLTMTLEAATAPVVRNLNQPSGPKRPATRGYRAPGHPNPRNGKGLTREPLRVAIVPARSGEGTL